MSYSFGASLRHQHPPEEVGHGIMTRAVIIIHLEFLFGVKGENLKADQCAKER